MQQLVEQLKEACKIERAELRLLSAAVAITMNQLEATEAKADRLQARLER